MPADCTCISDMHDPPPRLAASTHREEHFQACLTCLATDVRMCSLEQNNLSKCYSTLVGYQCGAEDGLPDAVCYMCARKLNKLKAFRNMSRRAYSTLRGLLERYDKISRSNIKEIDRKGICLESALMCYDLGHIDIEPSKHQPTNIDIKEEGETYLELNLNEQHNTDAGELVQSREELKNVDKLDVEYESESDPASTTDCYTSELPTPKQEAAKVVSKPRKKAKNMKGVTNKRIVRKDNNAKKPRSNEGKRMVKKVKSALPKVKLNRKKPDAKQHTLYTKEYYEKIAVVTVMTPEQQMEFFKQSRSKYLRHLHRCEECGMGFHGLNAFETHMLRHNPRAGDVVCDVCKICYKNKNQLAKHIAMFHRTKFECRKCPFVSSTHLYMRVHASKKHPDMPHFCDVCQTMFDEVNGYTEHIYGKHPESVSCATCGITVFSLAGLKKHRVRFQHEPDESSDASEVPCAQCGVVFRSETAYSVHRTSYPGHDTEHGLIECGACAEQFADTIVLVKHIRSHNRQWPNSSEVQRRSKGVECEQCGEHFDNGHKYYFHFKQAHPDKTRAQRFGQEYNIMCELCGKVFQNHIKYGDHMDTHNGVKRYKCDYCDKTFSAVHILNCHRRVHTKEKPYQCKMCEKRFSVRGNYNRHIRHVHTNATPYSCDICGKAFKYATTVDLHKKYVHERKGWPKRERTDRKKRERLDELEESY